MTIFELPTYTIPSSELTFYAVQTNNILKTKAQTPENICANLQDGCLFTELINEIQTGAIDEKRIINTFKDNKVLSASTFKTYSRWTS